MFGEIKKNKKNISKNILNSFNHDNLFVKKKSIQIKDLDNFLDLKVLNLKI